MEEKNNPFLRYKNLNVKIVQSDGYPYYGEVTEVGEDYLILKFRNKETLLKFGAILKVVEW